MFLLFPKTINQIKWNFAVNKLKKNEIVIYKNFQIVSLIYCCSQSIIKCIVFFLSWLCSKERSFLIIRRNCLNFEINTNWVIKRQDKWNKDLNKDIFIANITSILFNVINLSNHKKSFIFYKEIKLEYKRIFKKEAAVKWNSHGIHWN